MNASKYKEQFLALEEPAKDEIIELLEDNPTGRFIQPNEHHGMMTGIGKSYRPLQAMMNALV